MEGKPLGTGSPLGKSMLELAGRLAEPAPPAKKASLLSGLFSLFDTASTKSLSPAARRLSRDSAFSDTP